jgi:hypothetical protein
MALAAKNNNVGHVWSIDDGCTFQRHRSILTKILDHLTNVQFGPVEIAGEEQYLDGIAKSLHVESFVTFIRSKIDLNDPAHFDRYAFHGKPIDLVFSDFRHGTSDIMAILGHFLPRMASASSIFIDSASTIWPAYLLIEHLIAQINQGKIPLELQKYSRIDLSVVMKNRRIVLVHLTEQKDRPQNSTTWLKIEPVDLLPYPKTYMRGMTEEE